MQLLISDANILIDLHDGGLLPYMFNLPYEFATPDILFMEELASSHPNLVGLGLRLKTIQPEYMHYAFTLSDKHPKVSTNDCLVLSLAKQEKCTLLTGDRRLVNVAEKEAVIVKGTIWLVEQMVKHNIITVDEAKVAYQQMESAGSRLPFLEAHKRLNELLAN
ncbi:PIN domain-containing protein [Acinetobacter sp. GSS19]|uniref:PIN domain-containing protein n=1 Tax=Acinetobacter sp. GSS19 TaxID=3020716 RepID=UPI002361F5FE|nr:PIN domain-containing protein [Acinetobacter sp. GSS19]